jgi:hypothetical protein
LRRAIEAIALRLHARLRGALDFPIDLDRQLGGTHAAAPHSDVEQISQRHGFIIS